MQCYRSKNRPIMQYHELLLMHSSSAQDIPTCMVMMVMEQHAGVLVDEGRGQRRGMGT